MLGKIWRNRRSVVLAWLLSYAVILFVPILISVAVYEVTSRGFERQIHHANDSLLMQMREMVDSQVEDVKRLSSEVYANVKIQSLLYTNRTDRGNYEYELYQIIHDLKYSRSYHKSIIGFYLYWPRADLAIMPQTYHPMELLYEEYYAGGNQSLEQWRAQLLQTSFHGFVATTRASDTLRPVHILNYVSSLPAENSEQALGTVVIMIDSDSILGSLANIPTFNGGDLLILDQSGQILASSAKTIEDLPQGMNFDEPNGNFDGHYGESASVFFYIQSERSDLVYMTIVPKHVFWKELVSVRNLTYSSIAFSLIGGGILTFIFLRRHYRPLSKLLQLTDMKQAGLSQGGGNEFHHIESVLAKALDEKEQIQAKVKQQFKHLRANYIQRLLKGRVSAYPASEGGEPAFELEFNGDCYAVMLFYFDDTDLFFKKVHHWAVDDKLKLLQFIATNVVEEIVQRRHAGHMTEIDDWLACLVNLDGPHALALEELRMMADEAQRFLQTKFEIRVTIAISCTHQSDTGIPQAYQEAVDAMEYKLVRENMDIIIYEELQQVDRSDRQGGYYYPLQVEQQLLNAMKAGNHEQASRILDDIMMRNFQEIGLSIELTKCLLFDLVGTFVKLSNELRLGEQDERLSMTRMIEEVMELPTIKEVHVHLQGYLTQVCAYTAPLMASNRKRIKEENHKELMEQVLAFIETNYQESNLNLSMIGEYAQLKGPYLSRLFKEYTGEGLADYISKRRIDCAKILLREEKLLLQEAAERSGFNDLNTFIRTFKKIEGVTPGQYKTMVS